MESDTRQTGISVRKGGVFGTLHQHRRRHVYCAGTDVKVLKISAESFSDGAQEHSGHMPRHTSAHMPMLMSVYTFAHGAEALGDGVRNKADEYREHEHPCADRAITI